MGIFGLGGGPSAAGLRARCELGVARIQFMEQAGEGGRETVGQHRPVRLDEDFADGRRAGVLARFGRGFDCGSPSL
jgi:hypothetical protein